MQSEVENLAFDSRMSKAQFIRRALRRAMKHILNQLARTGLLPDDLAKPILAGNTPPLEEIVLLLVITGMDAYFVTINDPMTSKRERCIAHLGLVAAVLSAMGFWARRKTSAEFQLPHSRTVNYEEDSAAAPSLTRCEATGRHKASEDQKRGGTCAPTENHQRSKSS